MTASQLSTDPRRWLRQAYEDLAAAELLANDPAATPRHSCTFAYQAAEKALGATLVFLSIDVPLFRDLNALLELVPADWRLRSKHADVAQLSRWCIEAQDTRTWTEPTEADAESAVRQARAVVESVERELRRHGFEAGQA